MLSEVWGDTGNWPSGDWQNGRGPFLPPIAGSPSPGPGTYASFPTLSPSWSVHVRPRFSTLIAEHVSGREARQRSRAWTYYDVELTFDILRADAAHLELQTIAGFYLTSGGRETPFWLTPPGLASVVGEALGTGDGVTLGFPLIRSLGGYNEPVQATSGVTAVRLNGIVQASGWTVTGSYSPSIVFAVAPGANVIVSADFGCLWLCRFAEDAADLENFMTMLWEFGSVKLQMVRP
jgi:hypothetical protein